MLAFNKYLYPLIALLAFTCFSVVYRSCGGPAAMNSGLFTADRSYTGPRAEIWTADFSPGDSLIAAACVDSTLRIWHRDGQLLASLVQASGLTSARWSPDGKELASTGYDGTIYLWSWPEGRLLRQFQGNGLTAWSVRYSPDGTMLASSSEDGTITIRSMPDGVIRKKLEHHKLNVWDLAFSPDNQTLASGSFDNQVCVWRVRDGQLLRILTEHTQAVVALEFSADGKTLASASDDKTVRLWDVSTWKTRQVLRTPEHQQGISFHPDGKTVLTCGRDQNQFGELLQNFFGDETNNPGVSMRLWDAHTGAMLQSFAGHANDVNDVQFSHDGSWIISAGADRKLVLWKKGS